MDELKERVKNTEQLLEYTKPEAGQIRELKEYIENITINIPPPREGVQGCHMSPAKSSPSLRIRR